MSEYIVRVNKNDERWHYVERQYTHFFGYPITEEIVRCRDCRYKAKDGDWCTKIYQGFVVDPNGFCSLGKRKEG